MSITPETPDELHKTYDEIMHNVDVDALLTDLMRPGFIYQNAKAKGDGFPGAKTTRLNAEREIKRIIALHALGKQEIIRNDQRQLILNRLARAQRQRRVYGTS